MGRLTDMAPDLLLQLAAAKVGSAIEDIEQALFTENDGPGAVKVREVKDCLHDAREALRSAQL
jgi:hypothetical protein